MIKVKMLYFFEMKYLYLFMLQEKGLAGQGNKYGQGITQEIVEMLTKKDDD